MIVGKQGIEVFTKEEISNWLNWQINSNLEYLVKNFMVSFINEYATIEKGSILAAKIIDIIKKGYERYYESIFYMPIPFGPTEVRPYNCEIFENILYIQPNLNLNFNEIDYIEHAKGFSLSFLVDGKPMKLNSKSIDKNEVASRVSGIELNQELVKSLYYNAQIKKPLFNMLNPIIGNRHTFSRIKYLRYVHELQFCLNAYNQANDLEIIDEKLYKN